MGKILPAYVVTPLFDKVSYSNIIILNFLSYSNIILGHGQLKLKKNVTVSST